MNKKPNILVVTPVKVGLTETFIRAHIERLKGNVFYLYGWDLDFKNDRDESLNNLYTSKPTFLQKLTKLLPHHLYFKIQAKRRSQMTKTALISRYLKDKGIDVVLAEYGTAGSFISPVCRDMGVPLLVHFHGFDASRYKTLEVFKQGYKDMFHYASKIIVVSHAMKNALIKVGCPVEKLYVNTYGPHPQYQDISPDYYSNNLLAVGRHTYQKAPYLTILAFQKVLKKLPNLKLTMIGPGELLENSQRLVTALGLSNSVAIVGSKNRQEILEAMGNAALFVQHSVVAFNGESEGTPVAIIEAMAAGLPVVSTRHAGIPEVVVHDATGYVVEEGAIDEMADHIINLMKDREKLRKFGENARVRIAQSFNMEKHIANLNLLISAAIRSRDLEKMDTQKN